MNLPHRSLRETPSGRPSTLVSAADLASLLDSRGTDSPPLFLFDCRCTLEDESAGERAFREGHIPGAQYAHPTKSLSGPIVSGETGRHPLPDPDGFLERVRAWGVTNDSRIVVYDEGNSAFASRLWWMMRWMGHAQTFVLDGGLQAWQEASQPLANEPITFSPSKFERGPALTQSVAADELLARDTSPPNHPLYDARDRERFDGIHDAIDAIAGHIPGATCLPFLENLDERSRFKTREELADRFLAAGLTPTTESIFYCGSGITAAHNILAMVHAGFAEPALYPGSWSEWITDPGRPIATME